MISFGIIFLLMLIGSLGVLRVAQHIKNTQKEQQLIHLGQLKKLQKELNRYKYQEYLEHAWIDAYYTQVIQPIQKKDPTIASKISSQRLPDVYLLLIDKEAGVEQIQSYFIQKELRDYKSFFNTLLDNPLTPMQRKAVITHEENNLILAGAGSGKSSVIVAKVAYLLEKAYATPQEILILSFNKKAKEELIERMHQIGIQGVSIKTFHGLGRAIALESYEIDKSMEFKEMITLATQALKEQHYHSPYLYLLVDEFQDISMDRNALLLALKEQNDANLTAVGDDWQAINGFAGGEIKIIQNFPAIYGNTKIIKLDYTFRFSQAMARLSARFILKNPQQIPKDIKSIKTTPRNPLEIHHYKNHQEISTIIEQILQKISQNHPTRRQTVMILSRYGFQKPKNITQLQQQFPSLKLTALTIHASKGLESDHVIVTHLESGKFGFPPTREASKDEAFKDAQERRLFYVALTRTKEQLFLICHQLKPSPFVVEIEKLKNALM